jgi:DNA mismatch endonuclease (patch repair protein)
MRANRSVSGVEVMFRRALWADGARGFRRGQRLPGRPDLIFPGVHLAVFVHGCYWHRCPTCGLREVKANAEFWRAKFEANLARDQAAEAALAAAGWDVMVLWEHELRRDLREAARRLAESVAARRAAS